MGCGCKKKTKGDIYEMQKTNYFDVIKNNEASFVEIEYRRGSANHVVNSPTRGLSNYGLSNYGMHKSGDTFHVLKVDQETRPDWFSPIVVEKVTEVAEPKKRRTRKKKVIES